MIREYRRELGWLLLRFLRWATRRSLRNCQAVLDMLSKTEAELERSKKELQKALDKLKRIEHLAEQAARAGAAVMSDENVPRGNWAYAKAQNEVGNGVLRILGRKQHKPSTGKRLFRKLFL